MLLIHTLSRRNPLIKSSKFPKPKPEPADQFQLLLMALAFYPDDLRKAGTQASQEPECELENPIHPIFDYSKFNGPTAGDWNTDSQTTFCSKDAWNRMRPALLLASRLITSTRYADFWVSLIRASDEACTYDEEGRWMVSLISSPAGIGDRLRVRRMFESDICRRIKSINFATNGLAAAWTDFIRWSEEGQSIVYISISSTFYGAYLSSSTWKACTSSQRLFLHFQLAKALTHELAHVFSDTVFNPRKSEPMMLGGDRFSPGRPEIGYSWDRYFMNNGGLDGHFRSIEHTERYTGKWGMCLMGFDYNLNQYKAREWASTYDMRHQKVFAVPSSTAEKVFQEDWFNMPYPQWNVDLSEVPSACTHWIWGENTAEKNDRAYRREICKKVEKFTDKGQVRLVRKQLETMLGVKLDKEDYRKWLDPAQDVSARKV